VNAHVHVGFVDVAQFILMLIISGFLLRTFAQKTADRADFLGMLGKSIAYIY
jgi:hypothetical protein